MTVAMRLGPADPSYPTRLFGQIVIPPTATIEFPDGIPGFPDARQFAQLAASTPALSWLQSLDEPALAFLLVEWPAVAEPLDADGADSYAVVTLPGANRPATANLQAPILIDRTRRRGRQAIRTDAAPGTAVPIDLEALIRLS